MKRLLFSVGFVLLSLFLVFSCEKDDYTQDEFFNDFISLYCQRWEECKNEDFKNKMASASNCIKTIKEEYENGSYEDGSTIDDKKSGDNFGINKDNSIYACRGVSVSFDSEKAKTYLSCEKEASCNKFWETEDCFYTHFYCGTAYADLEWFPRSESIMNWQKAKDYCEGMKARLPNINELRKIIINCPGSTYGGACQVSDPDCLGAECMNENCHCDGSAETYSVLGDGTGVVLWSSSSLVDSTGLAWYVGFSGGDVGDDSKDNGHHARCVR